MVPEKFSKTHMPGLQDGSLGYHLDDGKIYQKPNLEKENKGHCMARRGDLIRCTAMFEEPEGDKVPVCFTLNGKMIVAVDKEDETDTFFYVSKESLYPYIALSDGSSVLAKVCI